MSNPVDRLSDVDDFEPYLGADSDTDSDSDADFDADPVEDTDVVALTKRPAIQSAWQRVDERRDDRWLREQMSDWDDYDDYPRMH